MIATPKSETAKKISAGIRELEADIERIKGFADRIRTPDRIGFQNQMDVLVQRQRTLVERLKLLRTDDTAAQEDLQRDLKTELNELQQAVRQVAGRIEKP